MAYTTPTADELQAAFPAFADVDDAVVTFNITRANRSIDSSWTEGDYATAIMLLACHYMVLAGLGTGAEAAVNAQGLAGFTSIRSGSLSLSRGATSQGGGGEVPAEYAGSVYGQQFYWLMRQNKQ